MTFYKDLQNVASGVLKEFNQGTIKLLHITQGTGGTPDEPATKTTTTYNLTGTVRGVSFKYLQEGFIVSTDLEVTVAVLENVTPSKEDFIEIDGKKYKIVENISVPASGTKCVWKFICRH